MHLDLSHSAECKAVRPLETSHAPPHSSCEPAAPRTRPSNPSRWDSTLLVLTKRRHWHLSDCLCLEPLIRFRYSSFGSFWVSLVLRPFLGSSPAPVCRSRFIHLLGSAGGCPMHPSGPRHASSRFCSGRRPQHI